MDTPEKLDCTHLQCPMPIVKLSLRVRELAPGSSILVEATDPAFEADIRAWSEMTGHSVIEFTTGATMTAHVKVA